MPATHCTPTHPASELAGTLVRQLCRGEGAAWLGMSGGAGEVRELKERLRQRGVDYSSVLEKEELVELLRRSYD